MAEIAISAAVGTAAERLSSLLIQEYAVLAQQAYRVEWIEKELRLMRAFLEHVERQGQGEDVNDWAEKLKDVACDAEDAIETFVIKSVKRRKNWLFNLLSRYKFGKELERIHKRILDVSHRRKRYEERNIGVVVETPAQEGEPSSTTPNTIVTPAIEKLGYVLSHNCLTCDEVRKTVEQVRDKFVGLHKIVAIVESRRESSDREKIWLDDIKVVCDFTQDVVEEFIKTRGRWCISLYTSQWKLRKKMKITETQIGDALDRRLFYGFEVCVDDKRDGMKSRSTVNPRKTLVLDLDCWTLLIVLFFNIVMSLVLFQLLFVFIPALLLNFICWALVVRVIVWSVALFRFSVKNLCCERLCYGIGGSVDCEREGTKSDVLLFCGALSFLINMFSPNFVAALTLVTVYPLFVKATVIYVAFCRSKKNMESIKRELKLMHALIKDAECGEGLNEMQRVWVEQIRVVAQQAEALIAAYELRRVNAGDMLSRPKLGKDIDRMLNKIGSILERKIIYGIANIEGRKGLVSLHQSTQGSEVNSGSHNNVTEHNNNCGTDTEEHLHGSLQHVNHDYHSVNGLKQKVETIRGEMQLMNALFKDVEEMEQLDRRVWIWVEQMKVIAHEVGSVIDDYDNEFEHNRTHIFKYFRAQYVINKKIRNIRKKIQDALRRREAYGLEHFQTRAESFSMVQRLCQRMNPSLVVKQSSIIGFDDNIEVLMGQLLSNEEHLCITSVVGIEGTGKTTLASFIFNNDAVVDHFHYRVWVSMAQNHDFEPLEYRAKQIMGVEEVNWTTKEDLIQKLITVLENKRYLIVIDDVQTFQVWDSLKKAIPDMSTGCRVLLISRNLNASFLFEGPRTSVHTLQLLNDEDSLLLFRRNLKVDIHPELMKVGKEIVIKCGGLPSEILKMGDLLSQKDVTYEEWSRVLEELDQYKKPWFETIDAIDMNLPQNLKRCLFYFVLFPAKFVIPARRLIVLWAAEGLVHQGDNEEPSEHVAERYLTELIDLNMVQIIKRKHNGKVKTCRLPYALRELWLTKAKESKFLHGHGGTNSETSPKNCIIRRVADHLDQNDICYNHIHGDTRTASASLRTYYKDVLSFLSFDAQEGSKPGNDIGVFLNRCISSNCLLLLRVLDLEHVYKPKLPQDIGRLSKLRYLGLRWTYLESLPLSMSYLLKLQTLDLKHTCINILPSSLWKMQLRHLYLSEIYRSRFPPRPHGGSLTDIQTLWGLFLDEDSPVKDGLDRLVNIRKLGLASQSMSSQQEAIASQLDAIADWLLRLKDLQSLRLKSRDEEGQPWNLHLKSLSDHTCLTDIFLLGRLTSSSTLSQLFPPSLIELTLSHSRLLEDPMQFLGDLPNLRSLSYRAESYMGKTMLCSSGSFLQLRSLKIWKLEQLEEWNIEQGALPCLRQLEIRSCGCLKMLPNGMQHVKTLLELKLTNMPMQFKRRIEDNNSEDWHKISHIPNVSKDDSH